MVAMAPARAHDHNFVEFRLIQWQTAHFDTRQDAEAFMATLQRLHCEAVPQAHGQHLHVSYRCPAWRRVTMDSHSAVHHWETWLKSKGFEIKHSH
jgi:hypothetical protein